MKTKTKKGTTNMMTTMELKKGRNRLPKKQINSLVMMRKLGLTLGQVKEASGVSVGTILKYTNRLRVIVVGK